MTRVSDLSQYGKALRPYRVGIASTRDMCSHSVQNRVGAHFASGAGNQTSRKIVVNVAKRKVFRKTPKETRSSAGIHRPL
ncbi:unnamed protein product [Tenebrio molitor]|nr:unnamed protein product [Tenebrio molitor]